MREKMHLYFEQQQNRVFEIENSRRATVNVEVIVVVEKENNKVELNNVSTLIKKEKVSHYRELTKVQKVLNQQEKKVEQNKVSVAKAIQGHTTAKPVDNVEEIIELLPMEC